MMFDLTPYVHTTRYADPFEELRTLTRRFFDEGTDSVTAFRTDIREHDNAYELIAELPGFAKEDISLNLDGNYLTITAKHEDKKEETKDNFVRRERYYGTMSRSFNVAGIRTDGIEATYDKGLLTLTLPKMAPTSKNIEIK